MRIRDAMSVSPVSCAPTTSVPLVARLMAGHDCSAIPVIDSGKVVGIITDRDITCRAVASGDDVRNIVAAECMTRPVVAIDPDETFERAIEVMADNGVHHLPVIRPDGTLVGIVAQSDLGRRMSNREFGALTRMTSIRPRSHYFSAALTPRRPTA
jgi:CBS domain-containing protein